MNQTTYERGIARGQRQLICSLIEDRFGEVPEAVQRDLDRLSAEQLRRLALKIGRAVSLADLGLPAPPKEGP